MMTMMMLMMIFENVESNYSGRMEIVSCRNLDRIIREFFIFVSDMTSLTYIYLKQLIIVYPYLMACFGLYSDIWFLENITLLCLGCSDIMSREQVVTPEDLDFDNYVL
jgi:hypothetical protein